MRPANDSRRLGLVPGTSQSIVKTPPVLPVAIVVTILALFVNTRLTDQHEPTPATAPATEFSGERAMALLRDFLAENEPHPVGSAANRRVKRRIQAWLDEQGIEHEEQSTWSCSTQVPVCGYVENVIARLPGQVEGPHVALVAHYDSTPHSPGAGDDMAGVVAVLETARAIRANGGFRHPVLLVLTDAEEPGLLGAEAFFGQHPLAKDIGVLLNVEGAGTRGPSLVLRTSMANAWYMNSYRAVAKQPAGTSLANEIFKHMPNDTDFSVAMRAGVPGIDFSFAMERNHYHTPNDSPAKLDPRTVQHHGDNLFPLALSLANADLAADHDGRLVYAAAYGVWAQWPSAGSAALLGVIAVLLCAAAWRSDVTALQLVLTSTVLPALVLAFGGALVHLAFAQVDKINGTIVSWPAHSWPFRLVIWSGMLFAASLVGALLQRLVSLEAWLLGAWSFVWLLSLLLFLVAPDAAPALLVPLAPAAVLLVLVAWLPLSSGVRALAYPSTLLASALFLHAAILLEATQGLRVLPAIWPWVGLFALTAIAFARGPWVRRITTAVLLVGIGAFLAATTLPLYSPQRPQHLSVWYMQDGDGADATLHVLTRGTVPMAMAGVTGLGDDRQAMQPWSAEPRSYQASTVSAELPAASLTVEEERVTDDGRRLLLRIRSRRDAAQLRLYLPPEAGAWTGSVEGMKIRKAGNPGAKQSAYSELRLHGMQDRELLVTLNVAGREPLTGWLVDYSSTLPAVARGFLAARPPTAVPVHWGDTAVVYRKVTF